MSSAPKEKQISTPTDGSLTLETAPPLGDGKNSGGNGYLRVFSYGQPIDYVLEAIGITAAIGSGVALAMVNLVIGDFITLLGNFSTGKVPDNFMAAVSRSALYFVYIGIARLALTYIYSSLLTYVGLRLTRNLRHNYLRAAFSQEAGFFFDQGTAGSIAMQATANGKLIHSGISEKLGQVFQAMSTFITAFILAFISQWKLTLILICILPALLLIVSVIGFFDAKIETTILRIYAQAGSFAESALGNIRAINAFSLGPRMTSKYSQFLGKARKEGNKKNFLYALMFGGEYAIMFAGMGLAFWQGFGMLASGEVKDIGTIFTVLFSIIIAAATINSVAPHMVVFSRAATAASELFCLIDRRSEINPFQESGEIPDDISGTIDIQGLTFSYPTRPDVRVLQDFSLHVPAGKVTALVGASGSGKSTIIGLLERWYNASAGEIRLDGIDIATLNLRWLRTNEPVLFNGTVFENIVYGLVGTKWEHGTREEQLEQVKAATKVAFAHEFIENLPLGYDTRIGERGGLLSGGQKQRIAIARSIISQPKILLLDEATSALDPHAEAIVQKALDAASLNRTTIVIAHKLKTIRNADNIVVMKQGRIVEQGQHNNLVAMNGAYARLVKAQDLSVQGTEKQDAESSDDSDEQTVQAARSIIRLQTTELQRLEGMKNREDFSLSSKTGVLRTIWKLVKATPELRFWFFITIITCIVGSGVYPGQTLLLSLLIVFAIAGVSTNIISQVLAEKIRKEMFSAMLRQDLRFFDRPENTVGSLASRLDSNANSIFELMGFSIALVVMAMGTVISCSILSITYSWQLGLVGVFAGIPPMCLAGYARIRVETKMDSEVDGRFSKSASLASETVNAIRTVSSLAIEDKILLNYGAELDTAIRESRVGLFHMMIWFSFNQAVEFFILALGFWWGSKLVADGRITFHQFMVSFFAVYFGGQGCGQIFSYAGSFTKANSAGNYFFWLLDLQPTIQETEENKEIVPIGGCRSFDFQHVEFSYLLAPDNRVLKGVSLEIQPGQFVALVGASGCGKSTMISLLERYYDPTSGNIIIDGAYDLAKINPRLYRSNVSLVQQEPTLFPVTIRENISMDIDQEVVEGDNHQLTIEDETIEAACRAANAWDFISSLPEGLNTPCGSSGSQLSGGQRQRIAIARALIRNPRVILLDEATSALDTESEKIVQGALMEAAKSGDRITVAVAHRLSTIRDAHRIFVFFGGRIAEAGTHRELLEQGGLYKKMCEAQSLDAEA
ncbi:multidrug resistance protein 1, 2, 3 (p glycoprotein 1, 2, 3) [Paramyrothecium foliicola]|nr:multidrug resistance protein 1, 2, 3 (p glycoprotein 1, 2, 3) [Paramyrothecium foliicola]